MNLLFVHLFSTILLPPRYFPNTLFLFLRKFSSHQVQLMERSRQQVSPTFTLLSVLVFELGASMHLVGDSVNHRLIHLGFQNHIKVKDNPIMQELKPRELVRFCIMLLSSLCLRSIDRCQFIPQRIGEVFANEISLRVRLDEIYMHTCLSSVYQFFSKIRGLYLNKKLNMVIFLNIGQMSINGGSKMAITQELFHNYIFHSADRYTSFTTAFFSC